MEYGTNKYNLKKIFKILFFAIAIVSVIVVLFAFFSDFNEIGKALSHVNYKYIAYACLIALLYFFLRPISMCILSKKNNIGLHMGNIYGIALTDNFFSGITPLSTGGQPFQAYALSRFQVPASKGIGLLLTNMLSELIAANIISITAMVFYSRLSLNRPDFKIVTGVGFTISLLVLIFFIYVGISKTFKKTILKLLSLLRKIKVLEKKIDKYCENVEEFINNMQSVVKAISKKKLIFLLCVLINIFVHSILLSCNYYIIKSLYADLSINSIFFIIVATGFSLNVAAFVPTPGASGGIEYVLKGVVMAIVIGLPSSEVGAISSTAVIIWRLTTYFLLMFVSFIAFLFVRNSYNKVKAIDKDINEF